MSSGSKMNDLLLVLGLGLILFQPAVSSPNERNGPKKNVLILVGELLYVSALHTVFVYM